MTRVGAAALSGVLLLGAFAAASDKADFFNDLGPKSTYKVAPFAFTDPGGRTVRLEDLRGKVWVANFFFTCCSRSCGPMNANLAELHRSLADRPDIAFVSFTVLPEYDTPERLQEYADALGADRKRWFFLTGPEDQIHKLTRDSFMQPLTNNQKVKDVQLLLGTLGLLAIPATSASYTGVATISSPRNTVDLALAVEHTPWLTVVDRKGNIRGILFEGAKADRVKYLEEKLREIAGPNSIFPAINATLNGSCTVLLVLGWLAIRARRETLHKGLMLGALGVSAVFLTCYLYYHIAITHGQPTRFQGEGAVRLVYFGILLSHTILAALAAPLALYTAFTGLRDRRPRHVCIARWTLPIWLYVSVTGVVVYWMLYQLYPPG